MLTRTVWQRWRSSLFGIEVALLSALIRVASRPDVLRDARISKLRRPEARLLVVLLMGCLARRPAQHVQAGVVSHNQATAPSNGLAPARATLILATPGDPNTKSNQEPNNSQGPQSANSAPPRGHRGPPEVGRKPQNAADRGVAEAECDRSVSSSISNW